MPIAENEAIDATFGGQTRNQEAVVQWTFHLERSSLFYLSQY